MWHLSALSYVGIGHSAQTTSATTSNIVIITFVDPTRSGHKVEYVRLPFLTNSAHGFSDIPVDLFGLNSTRDTHLKCYPVETRSARRDDSIITF